MKLIRDRKLNVGVIVMDKTSDGLHQIVKFINDNTYYYFPVKTAFETITQSRYKIEADIKDIGSCFIMLDDLYIQATNNTRHALDEKLNIIKPELIFSEFKSSLTCGFELETQHSNLDYEKPECDCGECRGEAYLPELYIGDDDSVEGVEIKTIGGKTYKEFLSCAKTAFSVEHDIDSECSFHIHLALPEIINDGLICLASEYLLTHIFEYDWAIHRMDSMNFFKPSTNGANKDSLIRNHPHFKTLEFRIFGNISTYEEAKEALNLAIESLWYAITQSNDNLVKTEYMGWEQVMEYHMINRKPLAKAA